MKKGLKVILGAVLLAVLLVLGISLPKSDDTVQLGPPGAQGVRGDQGLRGLTGPVGPRGLKGLQGPQGLKGDASLGSVVGPDAFLPYWSVNGVKRVFDRTGFSQATDTPCVVTSPSATSTLLSAVMQFNEATITPLEIEFAKGARESFATTTRIGSLYELAAFGDEKKLGLTTIIASSTPLSGDGDAHIFNPVENLVVKWAIKNTDDRIDSLDGFCNVVWETVGTR